MELFRHGLADNVDDLQRKSIHITPTVILIYHFRVYVRGEECYAEDDA